MSDPPSFRLGWPPTVATQNVPCTRAWLGVEQITRHIWQNLGNAFRIFSHPAKSFLILPNVGESCKISPHRAELRHIASTNLAKSCQILAILSSFANRRQLQPNRAKSRQRISMSCESSQTSGYLAQPFRIFPTLSNIAKCRQIMSNHAKCCQILSEFSRYYPISPSDFALVVIRKKSLFCRDRCFRS